MTGDRRGSTDLPMPTGAGWPVRLSTHVANPSGTAGRALLLHGLGSDGTIWWRLASQLADRGWLVLAPDLRSHGRSPTAIDHRIATLATDVALLGDGWDLVVGHSLGGAVAADLLARDDAAIGAAILLDPVLHLPTEDREVLRLAQRADVGAPRSSVEIAATNPRWHPRDVERKRLAAALVTPEVVDLVVDHNDPWDVRDRLASWRSPVEVLVADPDVGSLVSGDARAALAATTGVTVTVVAGAGHSVQRDVPEAVWAAADRALDAAGR